MSRTNIESVAFLASYVGQTTNATGDGTIVTVPFATERFDIANNYNISTYTFTAPVAGKYQFNVTVYLEALLVTHTGRKISLITTARTYLIFDGVAAATGSLSINFPVLCDMGAGDTAYVTVAVSGGTKTVSVGGGSAGDTNFSAHLVAY
jgi:hypothetical protein